MNTSWSSVRHDLADFNIQPLGAGQWYRKAARMLQKDLAVAGEAWVEEVPACEERDEREDSGDYLRDKDRPGRVADFHSLRHGFISYLVTANVPPKVAQTLARHSTITLTMDRYTQLGVVHLVNALRRLPPITTISVCGVETRRWRLDSSAQQD